MPKLLLKCSQRWLKTYRRNAAVRGVLWGLSDPEFFSIVSLHCYYCGSAPMRQTPIILGERRLSKEKLNGIDRVDSKLGYSASNCVPCCRNCNWAKRTLSQAEFIAHCNKILKHWSSK